MTEPPVFVEETSPAAEKRMPGAWIALGILFILLISNALAGALAPRPAKKDYAQDMTALKMSLAIREFARQFGMAEASDPSLSQMSAKLESDLGKDPNAARLAAVVEYERDKHVHEKVLAELKKGKEPVDKALVTIYSGKELSKRNAEKAISQIVGTSFGSQLARVQARERAGMKPTHRAETIPVWKAYVLMAGVIGLSLVFVGSLVVWLTFLVSKDRGTIRVVAPPATAISGADADRLAWRVFHLIASFYALSFLAQVLAQLDVFPSIALNLLPSLGILVLVFAYQFAPIAGRRITLESIGLKSNTFGKHVLWGFCGFLAEFPLTLILGFLGTTLLKFLPAPTHPATEILQNQPNLGMVMAILVLGAVIAPFWEEIAFRGLLFPALGKVMGGYVPAAIISSLLFAAIHPQGPQLWLSLSSVAVVSCIMVVHTKSLVPSITMHVIHNLLLLVFTVLIS